MPEAPRTYWVLHDYHIEGWKLVGPQEHHSLLSAVQAREADLANGGGDVVIVEVLDLYEAYGTARYERDKPK